MKRIVCGIVGVSAIIASGCDPVNARLPEANPAPAPVALGRAYDPAACGRIAGRVIWEGPVPVAAMLETGSRTDSIPKQTANPSLPRLGDHGGVGSVLVFVRQVEASRSRPLVPVTLEATISDRGIELSGGRAIAVVPPGSTLIASMKGTEPTVLRAQGAARFALPLPDTTVRTRRNFSTPGRVLLTSGADQPLARAEVFVMDHACYALTDEHGQFELTDVPEGTYELVVRVPNWQVTGKDIDPESGMICRYHFAEAVEKIVKVTIARGQSQSVTITVRESDVTGKSK